MPKQKLSEVDPSLVDKICTECLTRKPLEEFGANSKGRLGRLSKCKLCCAAKMTLKRAADPEAARAKERSYYIPHPRNPPRDQWPTVKTCTDCDIEKPLEDYYKNKRGAFNRLSICKECMRLRGIARYEERGDEIRAHINAKRAADPEAAKAYAANWRKNNPEAARAIDANKQYNRRAAIKGDKISAQEWLDLRAYYNNVCICCGIAEEALWAKGDRMTKDHVIPLSIGGRNLIWNIQPLCPSCNSKKWKATTDYRPLFVFKTVNHQGV